MANSFLEKQKRAIADNLIDTCGLQRAFHAAKQFGWHDIAADINDRIRHPEQAEDQNPVRH